MEKFKQISPEEFSSICRVCLLTSSSLLDIPSKISEVYQNITRIEINDKDGLPQNICELCLEQLQDIYFFIEKCKDNHSILVLSLNSVSNNGYLKSNCDNYLDNAETLSDDYPLIKLKLEVNELKIEDVEEESKEKGSGKHDAFSCDKCGQSFTLKKHLLIHIRGHKELRPYYCVKCKLKFKYRQNFLRHKKIHNLIYQCDICNKTFRNVYQRNQHKKEHKEDGSNMKEKTIKCSQCERVFMFHSSLISHMKTHTGEKPYSCKYCGKQFPYIGSLTVHTRIHTGETPYVCDICNKGYHSSTSLKKHKATQHYEFKNEISSETADVNKSLQLDDNSDKKECKICKKTLHKHGFGTHMRIHNVQKKQFICTFCSKSFQKNSHLERHVRIHTGERPFMCNICNKSFVQDGDLKRHLLIHSGKKLFQCQHCGKQYYTKGALLTHITTHTGKAKVKFECDICKKTFKQCLHYSNHINTHTGARPYLCTVCGKSFTASSSLKVHTRIHTGEMPFMCSFCSKSYYNSSSLKRHVMIHHTGEKPYICVICHKAYHDSTNLKRHVKRVHAPIEETKDDAFDMFSVSVK